MESAQPLPGRQARRLAALTAAMVLFALAVVAPQATAAEPDPACEGVSWNASVPAGENPYPMLTVTVSFDGDPGNCSMAFSLASYDTEGPTWPTSGHQSFLDFDTVTIDAATPSATLTVAEPACFGQTDFYLGSTRYDGIEAPLPHYPDVPTPYDKISGSAGGQACDEVPPPAPTVEPTPGDIGIGGTNPTPAATDVDLAAGGGSTGNLTPPPTDTVAPSTSRVEPALPLLVAAIGGVIAVSLLFAIPARGRARR